VLGRGHADSYAGLRINFVPHHSPVFIAFDDKGNELENIDIAEFSFAQLEDFMRDRGFHRKEVL